MFLRVYYRLGQKVTILLEKKREEKVCQFFIIPLIIPLILSLLNLRTFSNF
jgi:hypothetical protein